MTNYWENYYGKMKLEDIPWNRTQADWFKHAVDSGKVKGETALDLGCGVGRKSIYLGKNRFEKVVGIDISPSAIRVASKNATDEKVSGVEFIVHDIMDLSFLGEKKFDFVLDWAALHCIPEEKIDKYVKEVAKYTKKGGLLMLRVFSSEEEGKDHFFDEINGQKNKVTLFTKERVLKLYSPYFEITHSNKSKPRTHDKLIFIEFLMKKV